MLKSNLNGGVFMFKIAEKIKAVISRKENVGTDYGMTPEYIQYRKQKLVDERRKELEEATAKYGDDPKGKSYLILLKGRLEDAEKISSESQLRWELGRMNLSAP